MQCCIGSAYCFSRIVIAYPDNFFVSVLFMVPFCVLILNFLPKFMRCKVKAEAKVVRLIPNTTDETRNVDKYAPEYSYEYKGEQYTRAAKKFAGGVQYEIGSVVKLRIDPEQPEIFIDLKRELITKRTIIIIAIISLLIGIYFFPTQNMLFGG